MTIESRIVTPQGRPAMLEAIQGNWYEGSRWSPNRSWIWFPLQQPKQDLDRFTRYELNKHARYLYKNSPFIRGLTARLVTLTVGSGLKPVFRCESNPAFAQKARDWWELKSCNVHLGARASFNQYQRACCRARFVDGECYSIKTFDNASYADRVQGIEAERVTGGPSDNYSDSWSEKNKNYIDGITLNAQGTPVAYKVRGVDKAYAAEDVVHHFTPDRLGQYRGETIFASAINTARDVDDILALEKSCVKDASGRKDIITTPTGEINPETFRSLRYGAQGFPTVFSLPNDPRAKNDYYRIQFGAEPLVLQTGDTYTPYKPDRPGPAWQGFMEFLANTICLSAQLPPSVVLPIGVGGTDIRRDLDIAQRVVEPWQDDIALENDELLHYFLDAEIADGVLRGAPDDLRVVWHRPPKLNVDRNQAQQDRQDYQAGLMSAEEYHGRYGDDGDEQEAIIVQEVARKRERIEEAGFADAKEFAQWLSMDPKMFQQKPAASGQPVGAE